MFRCSQCGGEIPPADFNISTDLAYCRKCDRTMRCSELAESEYEKQFNLAEPPRNIRVCDDGRAEVLRYRKISAGLFFFVPFTLFWGGMTMFGISSCLFKKDLFELLFFVPFFLVTLMLLGGVLFMLFGRTELREQAGEWCVFTGVGPIGRRCRFAASEVAAVSCDWSRCSTNGQPHEEIVIKLKDGSTRKFGALMKEDSREYIFHYLKRKFGC